MQQHQYEALLDGQIRILTLQPGTTSQPLVLELRAVNLSDKPQYAAVSYCWGDPSLRTDVRCNGLVLSINNSLHCALKCLRSESSAVALWADAVCIDQQNIPEKNVQIPLMSEIYSRATHVQIWLGEADNGMQHVFQLAEKQTSAWKLILRYDVSWALVRILKRPWFRRIWVAQELAVSEERARINYAPGKYVSWSKFIAFANDFNRRGDLGLHRFAIVLERVRTEYSRSSSNAATLPGLLDLMHQFRDWEATDPRDKVYALLNLARDDEIKRKTPVDYAISPTELYIKVATSHLAQSLRYLSFCGVPRTSQKHESIDLPSWACDWSLASWRINDPSRARVFDMNEFFGETEIQQKERPLPPRQPAKLSPDGQRLCLRGTIVDTIKSVGHPGDPEHYFDLPNEDFIRVDHFLRSQRIITQVFLEAVQITHETRKASQQPQQESLEDTLGHVLLSRFQRNDPQTNQQVFKDWFSSITVIRKILQAAHLTNPTARGLQSFGFWAVWYMYFVTLKPVLALARAVKRGPHMVNYEERNLMFYRMMQGTARRRFAQTDGSLVGSVPVQAQVGDGVLVCQGGHAPFIVRQNGDFWELVGEAYIRGLHDSQAVEAEYGGRYRDIWLR